MGADEELWDIHETLIPQTRANLFRFGPLLPERFSPVDRRSDLWDTGSGDHGRQYMGFGDDDGNV